MATSTHSTAGKLTDNLALAEGIEARHHLSLSPSLANAVMLSRQTNDQSEYERSVSAVVDCLGNVVEHATRLTNTQLLDVLTLPIHLDKEDIESAVVVALERTHQLCSGATHAHARDVNEGYGNSGQAPVTQHDRGLLLLSSTNHLPHRRELDFWDTLEMAVTASIAVAIVQQAPPIAEFNQDESVFLADDVPVPTATSKVDWDMVELRLLRWKHFTRHGQLLPLPFNANELAGALLSGSCPASLCRYIHDVCMESLLDRSGALHPVHVFPEQVPDLLKVAAASLTAWSTLVGYHDYWMGNQEGFRQAVFNAVQGSLVPLDKGFGKGGVGLRLETLQNQSRFQELRKLVHVAGIEDDTPISQWHDQMPAWARTVLLFGANLALVRKRPVSGTTQAGRPPAELDTGLFTIKEAAARANASTSTIRRWLADGTIPKPARLPTSGDSSKWQIVFTEQEVNDLRLLAMSSDELADQLGVTDRSVRRRMTKLRKNNPGSRRLDLLKLLLGMDTGRGPSSKTLRGGKQ